MEILKDTYLTLGPSLTDHDFDLLLNEPKIKEKIKVIPSWIHSEAKRTSFKVH